MAAAMPAVTPLLHTHRLLLRDWTGDDGPPFAALNADPVVMEHFPRPLQRQESDQLMARIREGLATRPYGLWAVEVVGVAPFIGFVGLSDVGFDAAFTPAVEVGWRLAREHWGHGYATEAARAALAHGFEAAGLDRIVSFTSVANRRSRAVMERLGMRRDPSADFDHPRVPEGPLRRHVLYTLARADWLRQAREAAS